MGVLYNSRIVTDGLVLCLDAGDKMSYPGAGTTWYDLSGRNNHGTLNNTPTFSQLNGGCFLFDGTDEYISITTSDIAFGNNGFTVDIFFQLLTNANNYRSMLSSAVVDGDSGFVIGRDIAWVGNNGLPNPIPWTQKLTDGYFDDNKWYYSSLIRQAANTLTWYSNDTLIGTGSVAQRTLNSDTLHIGQRYNNNVNYDMYGYISCVRVYNRPLSAEEIKQNYKATKARFGL